MRGALPSVAALMGALSCQSLIYDPFDRGMAVTAATCQSCPGTKRGTGPCPAPTLRGYEAIDQLHKRGRSAPFWDGRRQCFRSGLIRELPRRRPLPTLVTDARTLWPDRSAGWLEGFVRKCPHFLNQTVQVGLAHAGDP